MLLAIAAIAAEPPVPISALQWLGEILDAVRAARPARPKTATETFGRRLARLRKARGLSQRQLAPLVGVSQRMLAYYEAQAGRPPAHVLPELAAALDVTLDELLGVRRIPHDPPPDLGVRLWRRIRQLQKLPPAERKAVLKVLDAYLDRYDGEREAR